MMMIVASFSRHADAGGTTVVLIIPDRHRPLTLWLPIKLCLNQETALALAKAFGEGGAVTGGYVRAEHTC